MSQESFFVSIDDLIGRYIHAQVVYVAAKLGLADLMCDRPRMVDDVAALVEVNPDALRRMMSSLVHLGVFERKEHDAYQLAAGHEVLRSDHPHSIRSYVIVSGEVYYRAFAELFYSVKTGKTGSEAAFGKSFFAYLGEHPGVFEHFNIHMSRRVHWDIEAAMGVYDFSPYKRVVDVGGGNGMLLSQLLQKYSQMRAILFDLPVAQIHAKESLEQVGVAPRCDLVSGDFFLDELPKGGDLYILSLILHDWDDEQALRILQNCHQAMSPESTLVLIEFLVQEQHEALRVTKEDLFMLVVTGGRERTSEQFRTLLAQARFQLIRTFPTQGRRSVIEATPFMKE